MCCLIVGRVGRDGLEVTRLQNLQVQLHASCQAGMLQRLGDRQVRVHQLDVLAHQHDLDRLGLHLGRQGEAGHVHQVLPIWSRILVGRVCIR